MKITELGMHSIAQTRTCSPPIDSTRSWLVWDDHETANNSWKDGESNHDPATEGDWKDRKAAAIQAHAEWMPFREVDRGRIYRRLSYGDLVDIGPPRYEAMGGATKPIDELIGEIPARRSRAGRCWATIRQPGSKTSCALQRPSGRSSDNRSWSRS